MAETIWNSAVSVYHFMMDNLVVINILLSLVIVFFQRRSPQTVWTWLLLLYFIPILGFVLYLLIGQDFHKSRMFKAKEIEGGIKYAVRRQEETIYRRRLRLTNPAVARYRDLIFYNLEAGQAVLTDNNDVRIYTDGKEKFKALLEEMQKAKKYIYIQTPYFILDKTLTDTLKIACFSGVDVRIMIPSKPDHPFVYWASSSYAGELLKYGAKLYNYDHNAFLHAKTIVVDDCVCSIGTANMDIRSFELNFEINAFMYSSEVAKKQRAIFENDILKSKYM